MKKDIDLDLISVIEFGAVSDGVHLGTRKWKYAGP